MAFSEKKGLVGTVKFASLKNHMGIEQTRRDDLFCLGYCLIYLLNGSLPWQNQEAKSRKEKFEKIFFLKKQLGLEFLCKDLPPEFLKYMEITYSLGYGEDPNYELLRNLFKNVYEKQGFSYDNIYDWNIPLKPIENEQSIEKLDNLKL